MVHQTCLFFVHRNDEVAISGQRGRPDSGIEYGVLILFISPPCLSPGRGVKDTGYYLVVRVFLFSTSPDPIESTGVPLSEACQTLAVTHEPMIQMAFEHHGRCTVMPATIRNQAVSNSGGSGSMGSEQGTLSTAAFLLRAAEQHTRSGVIIASAEPEESRFMSYPDLLEDASRLVRGLRSRNLDAGSKVALLIEKPGDFIAAFWACILAGYVPCPLAPIRNDSERWLQHLAHVDGLLGRPLFVSSGPLLRDLPDSLATADLARLRDHAPDRSFPVADQRDVAVLMLTSGSTGKSKAVELTHANLIASMAGRAGRQRISADDVMFNWIAFDHVAALLESHMVALYAGATQLHAEPAVILSDPLRFLRLIDRHRVSIAFAPNFLLGQINAALEASDREPSDGRPEVMDLSCLRRIVTGGEANVVETGRAFLKLLAPCGLAGNALWPAFGMTETCAACVYSDEFPECDVNREFASVGQPIEGIELRIVDEGGTSIANGRIGELQVRGPVIFKRYHNNEEATRAAFSPDGWFRTGDLGRIEEGRLSLVARSKDNIIVNGVNYYCHELETRLSSLDGIERSFVAAFPTRPKGADTEHLVVAFATTLRSDDEAGLYQLTVAIRNTTIMLWGFRPALILELPQSEFPKSSLGKIQRSSMRRNLEAGALDAHITRMAHLASEQVGGYAAPESSVETALTKIFADILGIDAATLSTTVSFFDLGGTSLDILKLTQALKRKFLMEATLPLILQNPSVRRLAARVGSNSGSQDAPYDPLVPMQVTGKKTPLFCVHPGNGEVLVLINLAKYFFGDRPFYALRPRGFNRGEDCFRSFEEIVTTYVTAIVNRQPQGPYAIAGYSLGCRIAFEIAKKLEARGERVAFLGCIDWYPNYESTGLYFNMPASLAHVLGLIDRAKWEELNSLMYPEPPMPDPCEYVFGFASQERLEELDLDLQKFRTWSRVAEEMEQLLFTELTAGRVKSLTVFCSDGMAPDYSALEKSRREWREQLMRWDAFAEKARYVDVPGQHQEIMFPKHVATFQAALRAEIDLAFQGV